MSQTQPIEWIRESFFYGDTLNRAVNLFAIGKYNPQQFRNALVEGLNKERQKYRRWNDNNPIWQTQLNEATEAWKSVKTGKPFIYKGVQVDF